jgi:hypothetical protein
MRAIILLIPLLWLTGCGLFTDPATRLAYAIEAGVRHLGSKDGDRYAIRYKPPSELRAHGGSYSVQLDKVGALIVWYKDANGKVTASGSTSYHSRFVDTPRTFKIDKPGNAALVIEIERKGGRCVITDVR